MKGQCSDSDNFRAHHLKHGEDTDSVTMGHVQEIKKTVNINVNKKAVLLQR